MKKLILFGVMVVFLIASVGTALAAPTKAKGPDFRPQLGVAIWTGNGGFISWWPNDLSHHFICKGISKLPQQAIDNMVLEGWWLSDQGPDGASTICKKAY